jgi:hypothetical protein
MHKTSPVAVRWNTASTAQDAVDRLQDTLLRLDLLTEDEPTTHALVLTAIGQLASLAAKISDPTDFSAHSPPGTARRNADATTSSPPTDPHKWMHLHTAQVGSADPHHKYSDFTCTTCGLNFRHFYAMEHPDLHDAVIHAKHTHCP